MMPLVHPIRVQDGEQPSAEEPEDPPPVPRKDVLLILDDTLQMLPWESLPGLQHQRYS